MHTVYTGPVENGVGKTTGTGKTGLAAPFPCSLIFSVIYFLWYFMQKSDSCMHRLFTNRLSLLLNRFQSAPACIAIRDGLVTLIPVLLTGAFALMLQNLPLPGYSSFLVKIPFIAGVLSFIFHATFGLLSVYATISISLSYYDRNSKSAGSSYGKLLTSLICFFILTGFGSIAGSDSAERKAAIDALGVKGMISAIICATVIPFFYQKIYRRIRIRLHPNFNTIDVRFKDSIQVFLPLFILILQFAILNNIVIRIFNVTSFHDLYTRFITQSFLSTAAFFRRHGLSFLTGALFILLSSILWFFGIHGSDALDSIMTDVFWGPNMPAAMPQLINQFVLIGGCGTSLCLFICLFLFSKRPGNRQLAKFAAVPVLFNINEIIVFGLPVIYNIYLLVPFLLTPLVSYTISYAAMYTGLVPAAVHPIDWTAPVLIGGYLATGSIRGSILQLVCVCTGICLYLPFVRAYDRQRDRDAHLHFDELISVLKESESSVIPVRLTEIKGISGQIANSIADDLTYALKSGAIKLYYQGQFDESGTCTGAEALLRWNHPQFGMIYPPLVVKLAEEIGLLETLEEQILCRALADSDEIRASAGKDIMISVNVLPSTLATKSYMEKLKSYSRTHGIEAAGHICLEVTEQTALMLSLRTEELFTRIHELGFKLAVDDFSMGHTSLSYLQNNRFDHVKLDGALVHDCSTNQRTREILASIINLSHTLSFSVTAEFIETKDDRDLLCKLGCSQFQGYLFGKAIPKSEFIQKLHTPS